MYVFVFIKHTTDTADVYPQKGRKIEETLAHK